MTDAVDVFEAVLGRYEAFLVGDGFDHDDLDVRRAVEALDREASAAWDSLDCTASRDAADLCLAYGRLRTVAAAWATPGTSLSGRQDVASALVEALRAAGRGYVPEREEAGNWWHWEIGAPRALLDTCVLLRARLPEADLRAYLAAVDHYCPDPDRRTKWPDQTETGANRADKAVITALSGLLARDCARVALARDGLSDRAGGGRHSLFRHVSGGDGFHADGSFVQHDTVAYTGAYGTTLLGGVALLLVLLDGSPWAVTDPQVRLIHEAVERSFFPVVIDGLMTDAVRGRGISRQRTRDRDAGAELVTAVLLLARVAAAPEAARWRSVIKGWLRRNPSLLHALRANVLGMGLAVGLLADPAVVPAPRPVAHHVFAGMDRVVHHRPRWSATLSLSSRRTAAYECGNGENLHGWYTGDGMLAVHHAADLDQFGDAFWPTADPYRLPGTTVDTRPREDVGRGSGKGTGAMVPGNAFAGGAVLDGRFGAAGLDLHADGSTLRARKAWFFVDDAVVALGAGITASDGRRVETVVEHRNLHRDGRQRLTVDGVEQLPHHGRVRSFPQARWAHLEGTGGYLFPGAGSGALHVLREQRTGTWRSINIGPGTGGDDVPHSRRFLTLWWDHGVSPTDAGYAYVLLPGASVADTAAAARLSPVSITSNGGELQAVTAAELGLTAALFWQEAEADGLACDGPAAVLFRRVAGRVSVAVSEPGRTREVVRVRLPFAARSVRRADPTISVRLGGPDTVLTVTAGGSSGRPHTCELSAC